MKSYLNIIFVLVFFTRVNAQQQEFIIGLYTPPPLVQESAAPSPGDFNGDGKVDLGSRINSGPGKGKFQIDYFNVSNPWFQKHGWSFKTTSSIYGSSDDIVITADYDGDGKADIGIYFPGTKTWRIDYAADNFGSWNVSYSYATNMDIDATAIPVPAKYDSDNKADISFKTGAGKWIFDYSRNGFGKVDDIKNGYGNNSEHPVPADYDGDGNTDLGVKTDLGAWKIDYYANGFKGWDVTVTGCGDRNELPVPADYNGDGKADLAVKTNTGAWKVTYSFLNGSAVNWIPQTVGNYYAGQEAVPFAADFNGDKKADFSFVLTNDGRWLIDNFSAATNGYDWMSYPGKIADDFNRNSLNPMDIANYTKIKNCSFNLILDGMSRLPYEFQKDYYLTLMNKMNLYTMLTDPHIYRYDDLNSEVFDKNIFVKHFNEQLPDSLRKRIYAINLGDEPSNKDFVKPGSTVTSMDRVGEWTKFFNKQYPGKPVFNNLLPRIYSKFTSDADYIKYLDHYKSLSNSLFVCFDHYPFGTAAFDPFYFSNLSIIKDKFADRSFWATVWSATSKVNDYENPDKKQLQFMAFCPVAYGAKGIVYFPYDKYFNPNFSMALNDDDDKYNHAKNINLFLKNIVGPVAIGCSNIATLHKANTQRNKGHAFGNAELLNHYKGPVKDVNDENILLGVFEPKGTTNTDKVLANANYFIWLVNKEATAVKNLVITLNGDYLGKVQISPGVLNYVNNPTTIYTAPVSISYNSTRNTTSFTIPALEGCEGIMIKLL